MWDHQVETLSARYRCIAYDFLGHGGSPIGPQGYSLEDEAENLHALMTQWAPRRRTSLGCPWAAWWRCGSPSRTRRTCAP